MYSRLVASDQPAMGIKNDRQKKITVSRARLKDVTGIKRIADANKPSIGFVLLPAVAVSISGHELLVARIDGRRGIVGFVRFHHRRDNITKVYEICVAEEFRGKNVGATLLKSLVAMCREMKRAALALKCPENLAANGFYKALGFQRNCVEQGKRRRLVNWVLPLVYAENGRTRNVSKEPRA